MLEELRTSSKIGGCICAIWIKSLEALSSEFGHNQIKLFLSVHLEAKSPCEVKNKEKLVYIYCDKSLLLMNIFLTSPLLEKQKCNLYRRGHFICISIKSVSHTWQSCACRVPGNKC